jgi:predicted O-methyltransferase YrrM
LMKPREQEMAWLAALLAREGVRSYLEIGSKSGGSLECMATALPTGSRIVSVDLPSGAETRPQLEACVARLQDRGYDAHLILGDSTAPGIIEQVAALGPYDACFIDADHSLPYVTKDWNNYGSLARIVAFHDISYVKKPHIPKQIDVPQFWDGIKGQFRHEECRLEKRHNGIGVLWR